MRADGIPAAKCVHLICSVVVNESDATSHTNRAGRLVSEAIAKLFPPCTD
jgi:hypothetical protein